MLNRLPPLCYLRPIHRVAPILMPKAPLSSALSPALATARWLWAGLAALLLLVLLALSSGAVNVPLSELIPVLIGTSGEPDASLWHTILWQVRLPRILLALIAGAALAVAGCAMQAVFRNPLAEPGLVGASSGAALGGSLAFVVSASLAPLLSFIGALLATGLAWSLASGRDSSRLLLAGVAINALCGSGLALLAYLGNDSALRGATFWGLGSLANAAWDSLIWLIPAQLILGWLIWRHATTLDTLLLGEREAFHLGIAITPMRRWLIALAALTVALTVAQCGAVGFVGLVAPHLVRNLLGPRHRLLLPGAALCGAMLVLLADWGARTLLAPTELPLGALLSLCGAPFFLYLLRKQAHVAA